MKKSEFLKELATILHEIDQEFKDKGYNVKALILSDKLDKLGILPPKSANPRYNTSDAMAYSNHPFLEYPEQLMINEWESED